MLPEGPTFWLLGGALSWRTGDKQSVAEDAEAGIRLAANPDGPSSLNASDGSLGGLVLPVGMALDRSKTLYILDTREHRIKRFDPSSQKFVSLPGVGPRGEEARHLLEPTNIAIAGNDLYIADGGNRRIQVFALSTLALRYVWGPFDENLEWVHSLAEDAWEPRDVAATEEMAVILDRCYDRVLAHRPGCDGLELIEPGRKQNGQWVRMRGPWHRIALDKNLNIYLLNLSGARPKVNVFDPNGRWLHDAKDAGGLLDRFAPPPIRLDPHGRFCLPESLTRLCGRRDPKEAPSVRFPLAQCHAGSAGLLFDRRGEAVALPVDPEPAGAALYCPSGTWISEPLDSRVFSCQWHRIEAELSDLPAGTKVVFSTYTDNQMCPMPEILALPAQLWETHYTLLGSVQPESQPGKAVGQACDALVQSHEGQYLWLRVKLQGDGFATPVVSSIRVHYPRDSYLKYLPAVYSADDESRRFLDRFLSIFQVEWDNIEQKIEESALYFDPQAVPGGAFLDYLAGWLALPMEGAWSEEKKRRLLAAAPGFYADRGTPHGLRTYLRVYLANISGLDPDQLLDFPILIEGFRRRNYLMLSRGDESPLCRHRPLWSQSVVKRSQLDSFATEGEAHLISPGDPDFDLFNEHAHRFEVYVPSSWVRCKEDENMIRRALDSEKPAHADYRLCLVEPRFRIGIQSTIGLDTIIGGYPSAILDSQPSEDEPPVTRPPRHRLGYDTVLTATPEEPGGMELGSGTRVGVNTVLS